MKKLAVLLLSALILISCAGVYAAGGTESDPLISLSYLTGTYIPDVAAQAVQMADDRAETTYQSVLSSLTGKHTAYMEQLDSDKNGGTVSSALLDQRYKRGDVITLSSGSGVMLLAGSATVSYNAGGAVIDITAGQTIGQGATLTAQHRYLVGENTTAAVSVCSDTAVISTEGTAILSVSAATDYNALASALKDMGLFRGTGTAYGSGYDLEKIPTRIEGLVMFLRLIGEEEAALAYTGENPFVDTPAWCERYTAYAYAVGYTKGINTEGPLKFGTDNVMGAGEYMTFLLRAMGYRDSGENPDFDWSNAISRSVDFGVLNTAEGTYLTEQPFLRAQVAYISYFGLGAPCKTGGTLLSSLTAAGVLDAGTIQTIINSVTVPRMS